MPARTTEADPTEEHNVSEIFNKHRRENIEH